MPHPGRRGDRRAKREMPVAGDAQQYARVLAMLGNNRVRARLEDASERVCKIRGSMRRRQWVHVGDVVLVALRDELAGDTADVVWCYQAAEVQRLRRLGEPVNIVCDEEEAAMDEVVTFEGDPDDLGDCQPHPPHRAVPDMPSSDSDDDLDFDDI